jgi:hypothetical protein
VRAILTIIITMIISDLFKDHKFMLMGLEQIFHRLVAKGDLNSKTSMTMEEILLLLKIILIILDKALIKVFKVASKELIHS